MAADFKSSPQDCYIALLGPVLKAVASQGKPFFLLFFEKFFSLTPWTFSKIFQNFYKSNSLIST